MAGHGPVNPGHGRDEPARFGGRAHVNQRHDQSSRRGPRAPPLRPGRPSPGPRTTIPAARNAASSAGVGGGGDAEDSDAQAGGLHQPVGREQSLAGAVAEVGGNQGHRGLGGQPPEERHAEREVSLPGGHRPWCRCGRKRGRRAARAARPRRSAGGATPAGRGRRQKGVARVQHQSGIGGGARAVDLGRAAGQPSHGVNGAAAGLVGRQQIRPVENRDRLCRGEAGASSQGRSGAASGAESVTVAGVACGCGAAGRRHARPPARKSPRATAPAAAAAADGGVPGPLRGRDAKSKARS